MMHVGLRAVSLWPLGACPQSLVLGARARGTPGPCMRPHWSAGSDRREPLMRVRSAGVAWFPLGPREVYVPARRFSPRYVERVNVSNSMIVRRDGSTRSTKTGRANVTYRNRAVPGAVTAVSRDGIHVGAPLRRSARARQRAGDRTRAVASASPPQIAAGARESPGWRGRARNVRAPPQTVVNRRVVVRREPPPAATHLCYARSHRQDRSPRAQAVSEAVNRNRPERAPRTERPVTESVPRSQQESQDLRSTASVCNSRLNMRANSATSSVISSNNRSSSVSRRVTAAPGRATRAHRRTAAQPDAGRPQERSCQPADGAKAGRE